MTNINKLYIILYLLFLYYVIYCILYLTSKGNIPIKVTTPRTSVAHDFVGVKQENSCVCKEGTQPVCVKNNNYVSYEIISTKHCKYDEICKLLTLYGKKIKELMPTFPLYPSENLIIPKTKENYASIGENCCIKTMEWLFPGYKFIKIRPNWLKNPETNKNLELDGYCEKLKMGVEYNGKQHYVWPNQYNQNFEDFINQRKRDLLKRKLCIINNVYLLHVPYSIPHQKIPYYIYIKLINSIPKKIYDQICF